MSRGELVSWTLINLPRMMGFAGLESQSCISSSSSRIEVQQTQSHHGPALIIEHVIDAYAHGQIEDAILCAVH